MLLTDPRRGDAATTYRVRESSRSSLHALLWWVCSAGAMVGTGQVARADQRAASISQGATDSTRLSGTLIAPSAEEATQWQRLRSVQAAIPANNRRELPFASLQLGRGSVALISQENRIGGSFRLQEASYVLDDHELPQEQHPAGSSAAPYPVFRGRMLPGSHDLRLEATIHGYGYGVFSYMQAYRLKLRAAQRFEVRAGETTTLRIVLKEDPSAPLENRFSFAFKLNRSPSKRSSDADTTVSGVGFNSL